MTCGRERLPRRADADSEQTGDVPARRKEKRAPSSSAGRQPVAQQDPPRPADDATVEEGPRAPAGVDAQVDWQLPNPLPPLFRRDVLPTKKSLAGLKQFMSLHEPATEEVRFAPAQRRKQKNQSKILFILRLLSFFADALR
jgi:hypothetical protein